ncbi:MAG: cupin domain-containing protein [Succinivibrio sp.]|nr:cupin domain-containing protein [Succinivibrio sp.]
MRNESYTFKSVDLNANRTELHDLLKLTGCEVSINSVEPNSQSPFFHYHKQNEEVYVVLEGSGFVYADGETIKVEKGSVFRMAPSVKRCIKAKENGMRYLCIQCKENSLTQFTFGDGAIDKTIEWKI